MSTNKQVKIKKTLQGIANAKSVNKTVGVVISTVKAHPMYGKRFSKSKTILVHTDGEIVKGQEVRIEECRPFSKNKAWQIVK